MTKLTAGQALIQALRAQEVESIFGIISSHTLDIFDALYDHRDAIRFIGARHEHAAAMMADGYARVTGKPGVCLTSTGPGAANSMGGMGEAYFASAPVLHLTSTAEELANDDDGGRFSSRGSNHNSNSSSSKNTKRSDCMMVVVKRKKHI